MGSGEWAPQGIPRFAMGETQLQLWAEGPVHALMSLLPGEWVRLRSPGVGKEARQGAGRLCMEQTWLDSSLGYPVQGEETLGCHGLSAGHAGAPGGWDRSRLGSSTS